MRRTTWTLTVIAAAIPLLTTTAGPAAETEERPSLLPMMALVRLPSQSARPTSPEPVRELHTLAQPRPAFDPASIVVPERERTAVAVAADPLLLDRPDPTETATLPVEAERTAGARRGRRGRGDVAGMRAVVGGRRSYVTTTFRMSWARLVGMRQITIQPAPGVSVTIEAPILQLMAIRSSGASPAGAGIW